jgi:hypothetical protein
MTILNEWIKNIEQQIKDPFTNDLHQTANVLKEKYKSIQIRTEYQIIYDTIEKLNFKE